MRKTTALSEVPVGTTFEVWNRRYTVLDRSPDKVFVLAAEIETGMPFSLEYETWELAPNDFRDSTAKSWLNEEYLELLRRSGMQDGDILDIEVDLKCTLGQHEYGKDKVKVGLLTLEQYGTYHNMIPALDRDWWLVTPMLTPKCRGDDLAGMYSAWIVQPDVGCAHRNCEEDIGLRPALNLSPSLRVAWGDITTAKTRQDVLLETFPDVVRAENGIILLCPCAFGKDDCCQLVWRSSNWDSKPCADCRHDFWLGEAK